MNNKKEKLIYWLIGLGTGMVISSMLMLVIGLKMIEPVESVLKEDIKATVKKEELIPEIEKEDQLVSQVKPIIAETSGWITIEIPSHYGSEEIAMLLQEKQVVEDGKEFLEYIQKEKKTKFLQHGMLEFPINGQYHKILDILLTPNQ